jgi:phage terminase large subunit
MMTYEWHKRPGGLELRGAALELWRCREHEVIICGPAETGKTYAALHRLDALMWKYPHAQGVIVRKTYKSTVASVLQTYMNKVIAKDAGIAAYGGERPDWFDYPNGSRLWVGGMDSADKVLSSERDFVYVNQAEELTLDDWETLGTRCTGRAGNAPWAGLFGDCNPATQRHWIRERAAAGRLRLLQSYHRDNPTLYDEAGQLTPQGERSLAVLNDLTGVRRKRLLEGEWATAEGAVYPEFSHETHVREIAPERFGRWFLAEDEGYTNPAVVLLIGIDADDRLHVAREFYQRNVLQDAVVALSLEWVREFGASYVAVDAAAAGLIAALCAVGIQARPFKGRVQDGIALVRGRLKVQADGLPRLTVDPSCVNTINEFESYVWKPERDEPMKENDHAMDALRYGCVSVGVMLTGALMA